MSSKRLGFLEYGSYTVSWDLDFDGKSFLNTVKVTRKTDNGTNMVHYNNTYRYDHSHDPDGWLVATWDRPTPTVEHLELTATKVDSVSYGTTTEITPEGDLRFHATVTHRLD